MPIPTPEVGLVISYSYLWKHEQDAGAEEGRKVRPCVIILAVEQEGEHTRVTVAPVTHTPPRGETEAVEIPAKVKRHLNLDDERSWVMVSEVNEFAWPGFDLRPIPGKRDIYEYGFIPPKLYDEIKRKLLTLYMNRRTALINRDAS